MTKKIVLNKITFMVLVLLIYCLSQVFTASCGDVDSSGIVGIVDALIIAQYYVGLNPPNFDFTVADVNGDGVVDIIDALQIARYYVNLITELSCSGGTPGPTPTGDPGSVSGLEVFTDTNRDGRVDQNDIANFMDWTWNENGAFLVANVDDDDRNGRSDAADQYVNETNDENDLAKIILRIDSDLLSRATDINLSLVSGAAHVHLFEKSGNSWTLVNNTLNQFGPEIELGIEGMRFADVDWNGFVNIKVDMMNGQTIVETKNVRMRVAPWLMLPNSAKTELVYILDSSVSSSMRSGINAVLQRKGLPDCQASAPGGQDQWFQDTMEVGFTQLPGFAPMHVVMNAQRGSSDNLAPTLLAPDFGFISIGSPRNLSAGDWWMDWMGNLEVTHPLPGHPFGRIYYGRSSQTTFHPTIVSFLEAQELQRPFSINTEWLVIQHVDEVMNFIVDSQGRPKMLIISPFAANEVLNSGYDSNQQRIQELINGTITTVKNELGITDADIIHIPQYFEGSGNDFSASWANSVNSIFVNGTLIAGDTNTPAAIKTAIENKLQPVGVDVVWVDDANYHMGGGNTHCGTNTKKTPVSDLQDILNQ
jgi:hypothetical protein